jgi:1-aminocyclopropane-1-carboxylate deaminase/D-cysteine desulfhydrase-like pyridoxal-dependent ACC family enzyme
MGSNFAIATALHAPRLGLAPGAIFFPQPLTPEAEASHRVVLERAQPIEIAHWSLLPLATARVKREAQSGKRAVVLPQVGLAPESLLGYLSAGLELAQQVARGEAEAPECIVLPIGSAATSAGLLAGLSLAKKWGIWRARPRIAAVRIAAFPLSRKARVLGLTRRLLARLSDLTGKPEHALAPEDYLELSIVTDQLGRGYPHPTSAGRAARERFAAAGFPILDDTYSAKAAAHALELTMQRSGPTLFWCTKSSAPLPPLAPREPTGSSPS